MNLHLPTDEVRRRETDALAHVGLSGFEARVPFHLSGGEKRRAALAGVLAMQPAVLLLDEPSMFLDPRGRRELIGLLNELAITKVIASHDLEMILDTCQRVVVLDQERLIAAGPSEMLELPLQSGPHGGTRAGGAVSIAREGKARENEKNQ